MNFDNFTIKAQQAVQTALERATQNGQQAITPVHLLAGVLAVGENVTKFVFGKLGVNETSLQAAVNQELQHFPRVSGGNDSPYLDSDANKVVLKAQDIARKGGDTYVGLEPMLQALLDVSSTASQMLKDAGVTADALKKAIEELRGGQKATSQSSEDTYQSLSKYARNLVEEAREGKLDPVIGRDEEIRRVLQILSRRTKITRFLLVNQVQVRRLSWKDSQNALCAVMCLKT